MKTMIMIVMAFLASDVMAINKCLIDGKVSYQKSPCPKGTARAFEGAVSSVDSGPVRGRIEEKRYRTSIAKIEMERQQEKMLKLQQVEKARAMEEKIEKLERDSEGAQSVEKIQMMEEKIKKLESDVREAQDEASSAWIQSVTSRR